jgi:hypothetical protein
MQIPTEGPRYLLRIGDREVPDVLTKLGLLIGAVLLTALLKY